jgi:hypothetical protein
VVNFRRFNGTTDVITLALGALSGMTFGTIAVLCRRTDETQWMGAFSTRTSGGTAEVYIDIAPSGSSNNLWYSYASTGNAGLAVTAADDWVWTVIAKGTGSVAPRTRKKVMSTGTWTNANGAAIGNGTSPSGGSLQIGNSGGDFFKGDIAAVAVWLSLVSDATLDAMSVNWPAVLAANPDACWLLNQASVATPLDDVSSTGTADQTAISGTTVQTGTIPNWSETAGGISHPAVETVRDSSATTSTHVAIRSTAETVRDNNATTATHIALRSTAETVRDASTTLAAHIGVQTSQDTLRDSTATTSAKVAVHSAADGVRDSSATTGSTVLGISHPAAETVRDSSSTGSAKIGAASSAETVRDSTTTAGTHLGVRTTADTVRESSATTGAAVPAGITHPAAETVRDSSATVGSAVHIGQAAETMRESSATAVVAVKTNSTRETVRTTTVGAFSTLKRGATAETLRVTSAGSTARKLATGSVADTVRVSSATTSVSFSRDVTVSGSTLLYTDTGTLVAYRTTRLISREGI